MAKKPKNSIGDHVAQVADAKLKPQKDGTTTIDLSSSWKKI